MSERGSKWFLGGCFAVLLAAVAWVWLRPQPSLAGVDRLVAGGKFDQAERRLTDYLRVNPTNEEARQFLVQILVDRVDKPQPSRALEHLAKLDQGPDVPSARRALLKVLEGKAYFLQNKLIPAEAAWRAAIELDPAVPEGGWGLLNIYAMQDRAAEARELALRLFEVEPDPRDRVQLLLQLLRADAHPSAAGSLVQHLAPAVETDPSDLNSARAYGLALVRDAKVSEGLAVLERLVREHPDDAATRLAYLAGLAEAGDAAALEQAVEALPAEFAEDPRFAEFIGRAAQERGDWAVAAQALTRAWEMRPYDEKLAYRLGRALRNSGDADPTRLAELQGIEAAQKRIRGLYDQANDDPHIGRIPRPRLYQEIASVLERLHRYEEARAWHRLVLRDRADDPVSKPALERLDAVLSARGEGAPTP